MESRYGTPYVLATSGSIYDFGIAVFWKGDLHGTGYYHNNIISSQNRCFDANFNDGLFGFGPVPEQFGPLGVLDYEIVGVAVSGTSPNRTVSFTVNVTYGDANVAVVPDSFVMYATVTNGYVVPPIDRVYKLIGEQSDWVALNSWSESSFLAYTKRTKQIVTIPTKLLESTYGNVFSGRIMFEWVNSHTADLTVVRRGEVECQGEGMFNSGNSSYSYFTGGQFIVNLP